MKRFVVPTRYLVLVLVVAAFGPTSRAASLTRERMLENIADAVIVPAYQGLARASHSLSEATAALVETPEASSMEEARKAWSATANAAARVRCFQSGPMTDREYATAFFYWQVLPRRIESLLAAPFDVTKLDEQGGAVKGLFAMEYLLFDKQASTNGAVEALASSQSRRTYLLALARDLETKSAQVAGDWMSQEEQGARAKFVGGGEESVQLLVNNLTKAVEEVYERRLNFLLVLPKPISRQLDRILRSRSGGSLEEAILDLANVEWFYQGADGVGIDDLVEWVNPELAKKLPTQFEATLKAVRALDVPLEQAVVEKRAAFEEAAKHVHTLEVLFKVDLASALGVTLTFSSNDGD